MNDPLDNLLARTGKTREELSHRSRLGHIFHKGGVRATEELRRILALPSYRWQDDPDVPALCDWITQTYGLGVRFGCKPRCGHYPPLDDGCSECDRARRACVCKGMGYMTPRPVQAAALQAIHDHKGLLANIRVGGGKCLGRGTPVMRYDGEIVPVEQIRPGDRLMGPDSTPRHVLSTTEGVGPLYRVRPVKGDSWVCNDAHMLTIKDSVSGTVVDVSVSDFLQRSQHWRNEQKLFQPSFVNFEPRPTPPVDPYFVGLWLGDGSHNFRQIAVTTTDPPIVDVLRRVAHDWGLRCVMRDSNGTRCPTYFLTGSRGGSNPLLDAIRALDWDDYRYGSVKTRRAVLAGFLDADGYYHHGHYEICQRDLWLADDLAFMARSVGLRVTHRLKRVMGKDYHRLFLSGDALALPLILARKRPIPRRQKKDPLRTGFTLEPLPVGEYFGFELDGDGRFLLGDFTITHNTLIHYLAGVIVGAERTLLIIPAKLRKKTQRDFALLRKHWVAPQRMHIISYELLSRDRGLAELNAFQPDLIATDESHKFQNEGSACWIRTARYLKAHPETIYVDMSGTMTKRSLMDYHHRAMQALPEGQQPLPRTKNECREWSGALDVDPKVTPMKPGALIRLCNEEEVQRISLDPSYGNTQAVVRSAYARRLLTAPGVVGTEEDFDGSMSLLITGHEFPLGEKVIEAFKTLRDTWALPDGHPIDSPTELWRHARELAQGMFYKWTPDPPQEWLLIRKAWSASLRQIRRDCHEFESDLMVVRAIDAGRLSWAKEALENWRAIRDIYKPTTVAKWIDDTCLRWVEDWASKGDPGVVWCWETHFARELAKRTGLSYYGSKGLCNGKMIEDETKTCIASIKANYEGRNLQDAFARNLVVSTPPGADVWEQILGRTHRDGQRKDEVTFDVLLLCYEQWNVFRQARRRAEYVERTMRQCQKLNFADIDIVPEAEIMVRHASGDPLWCKTNADFFEGGGKYTLEELGIQR